MYVIESIINRLKEDPKYGTMVDSKSSYIMISTGSYRPYDKGRINFLIFKDNKPTVVVKFYKQPNDSLEKEFKTQKLVYEKLGAKGISKPLGIVHLDNMQLLLEEAIVGKSLERYLFDNHDKKSIQSIMQKVLILYHAMNDTQELSSFEDFSKEVDQIVEKFTKLYLPNPNEIETIKDGITIFLEHFKNNKIYKRFSNGDFVPKNLIVNGDVTLIDFEFAEETHLYFLDWFRFFKYQFALPNNSLFEMLHTEITDQHFMSALRSFSNNYPDDEFNLVCRLVFEIKDYVLRWPVTSDALYPEKKKEMHYLIEKISQYLYGKSQVIEKPANVEIGRIYENPFAKTIDDLYREILRRPADEIGLQHFASLLESGKMSVYDIRKVLLESEEYKTLK